MRRRFTDLLVIHCAATKPNQDIGAAEIDEWHRAKGWAGIGYALVIRRDGTIEFGRHFDEQGAHVAGYNDRSVGICLVGGLDANGKPGEKFDDTFTPAQRRALSDTLRFLRLAYPGAKIVGHRDLSPDTDGNGIVDRHEWVRECPTFSVSDWTEG